MIEAMLRLVPLGFIFRSIFPGAFFIASFAVAAAGWASAENFLKQHGTADLLFVAIFSGIVVYMIHRSLLYPIIECAIETEDKGELTGFWRLISQGTAQRLIREWRTPEPNQTNVLAFRRHMTVWNDYVHLQYVSAECMGLGAMLGRLWTWDEPHRCDCTLLAGGGVLLIAAIVADRRRKVVQHDYFQKHGLD